MIKPLNQLNAFFKLAEERTLSGSDQLLYFHLFNQFNKAHWTETVHISDKALLNAMRLYDSTGKPAHVNTIRNAKSRLKLKGFIDFTTCPGEVTEYKLIQLYPCDTPCDTPCGTPCGTPCDTLPPSHINNAREDATRRKDVKTLKEEEEERTRDFEVSEKTLKAWEEYAGIELIKGTLRELHELEHFFGIDAVAKAIRAVHNTFNKVNIDLVRGNLYRKNIKGGTENERINGTFSSNKKPNFKIDECPDI